MRNNLVDGGEDGKELSSFGPAKKKVLRVQHLLAETEFTNRQRNDELILAMLHHLQKRRAAVNFRKMEETGLPAIRR